MAERAEGAIPLELEIHHETSESAPEATQEGGRRTIGVTEYQSHYSFLKYEPWSR